MEAGVQEEAVVPSTHASGALKQTAKQPIDDTQMDMSGASTETSTLGDISTQPAELVTTDEDAAGFEDDLGADQTMDYRRSTEHWRACCSA